MKRMIAMLVLLAFLSAGCEETAEPAKTTEITDFESCAEAGNPVMESYPRQCSADGKTFTEAVKMDINDAIVIAEDSECSEKGSLTGERMFNEYTNTWWIGMDMKEEFAKKGCNPSCVVNTVTREAEINWRCTGLIVPEKMTKEICDSAGGHWNECSSRCGIDNQGKKGIYCTAVCEELCECGGIAGFSCPEGYACRMPEGTADALGYCDKK